MLASRTRWMTIIGQDPSLRHSDGKILTARVAVPYEDLSAGPRGYRVHVIDYDSSTNRLYKPLDPRRMAGGGPFEELSGASTAFNQTLLKDPRFHAQNVYAIVMRTLAQFERALGRRVGWSFGGHQLKVAPHAFAEANAYYSPEDEGVLFGYFGTHNGPVFTSLSHDIVAHETTHALVDGLRPRYMEPSSPDQGAFHEGFADVVALLSVFSLPEVLGYGVRHADRDTGSSVANLARLTVAKLKEGVLLGLGEQFGEALSGVHGAALRRSVKLRPSPDLLNKPDYAEEHTRGEILVASMLGAFLAAYKERLDTLGRDTNNRLPRTRVAEEGADIADRLLTLAIRALDYTPPTDLEFGDFLSALITSDREIRPDDGRYRLRQKLLESFAAFGIQPSSSFGGEPGRWAPPLELRASAKEARGKPKQLNYSFVHHTSLERDRDEVFRFLWDNRGVLGLCDQAQTKVGQVLPCLRVDQDGFTLRETVADYVQILTLRAGELENLEIPGRKERIQKPKGLAEWKTVRLLGGGALLFDEFGQLKYHVRNAILSPLRQTRRLQHLFDSGFFDGGAAAARSFAAMHMKGMRPDLPPATMERDRW
ncbi:MAG TPA: hypothetical protein VF767_11830 [Bryobacteraceae bacterium]